MMKTLLVAVGLSVVLAACGGPDSGGDNCAPAGTYALKATVSSQMCTGGDRTFGELALNDITSDGTSCGTTTATQTSTVDGCTSKVDLSFRAAASGFTDGKASATATCDNGVTCNVTYTVTFTKK